MSKNYFFNCFFLIYMEKGGVHKTKVLDSMLVHVLRFSHINTIELKSFNVLFLNKNVQNTGQKSVRNGPNLSSSLVQILMGDTSLSEARYNYYRIFTLFTKYVFICHYPSIFIHRWRYKSTNLL